MATTAKIGLWKYGRITGLWALERMCIGGTGRQWLEIFRRDEPAETFILSIRRPKHGQKEVK